jgi:hypothetical protein
MTKSSTRSRTEEFFEMFPGVGIKDANACLYWVKQLVETSTNGVLAGDQMFFALPTRHKEQHHGTSR